MRSCNEDLLAPCRWELDGENFCSKIYSLRDVERQNLYLYIDSKLGSTPPLYPKKSIQASHELPTALYGS